MSTPPGKQQQQQRQRGGGAGGRGQSTTPGHGIGKGGAQQAPRGRRGRKSGKKPASPQSTGEPRTAGVPSPSSASGVKKETSSQPKAGASLSSVKTGKPSDAPTSAASRQLAGTNDTCASREGPQQESMSLSLQPTKQQETSLFSVPSPVLDATSPSIETTLPLLTSHLKEKGAEDGSVSLSEVKLDDYGVARRLLNFTRGPGDCESEVCPDDSTSPSAKQTDTHGSKEPDRPSKVVTKQESDDRSLDGGEGAEGKALSKAELKRQRREKQEAQRLAKQQKKGDTASKSSKPTQEIRVSANVQADDEKMQAKVAKKLAKQQIPQRTEAMKQVEMFSHLHQYRRELPLTKGLSLASGSIHPAVVKLGLQYADGIVCGSNARCIGLLAAFKQVIQDYSTPSEKVLSRDLEQTIKPYISFLAQSRPLSVSMGNAIKYLKWKISTVPPDMPEEEAKEILCNAVDDYYRAKILLPDQVIQEKAADIIRDGDVILVHAFSSIVLKCLTAAHKRGKDFRVIVVDSRPKLEGRECLNRLVKSGVKCSYVLINAVTYIMKEVTKVLVGAHALLANGYVMSRVGTSLVALVAKTFNVPVLVCCETYKFCERVQTDAFVFNELGDPADVAKCEGTTKHLADWKDVNSLAVLNLVYDVTSPDHVAMVITERGNLPCTSVPVVLRVSKDEERAEIMRVASESTFRS